MSNDVAWLDVPDGFEFGWVKSDEDLEEVVLFNDKVHGPGTGEMLHRFIEEIPGFGREMNYFIRDLDTGKIASSLSAIPATWSYEDVPLNNLELGFVGTLEEYRRRGLFDTLYKYFDYLLRKGSYDISSIQGIPYFYRKYGYDFMFPLGRNITLYESAIPSPERDSHPPFMDMEIRGSTEHDIPKLMELYCAATSKLMVFTKRDLQLWQAQERTRMIEERPVETMIIEQDGHILGYFRVGERRGASRDHVNSIFVSESSILSYKAALRTIQFLKQRAELAGTCLIEVPGDMTSNLAMIVLAYGGFLQRGWKYQIRVPNLLGFLRKICPVLEKRLNGTMYSGLTDDIQFNTYRTCFRFDFIDGHLRTIEDMGMQATGTHQTFRIPPHDFVRLILGDYSVDELQNYNTDFLIRPGMKHLLETLFPKKASYLYNYQV